MIYWLTGQPGSGKTTIAKSMLRRVSNFGTLLHIDGDDIRDLFDNKDYSENGRRKNVELAQQIAEYLNSKQVDVVVSLVSPYKDQRDKFKKKMGKNLTEVYVHTSEIRGKEDFFVSGYEKPDSEYIDIDTTSRDVNECVDKIFVKKTMI